MERAEFICGRILFWGIVRTCEIFSVKTSMRKLRFSKRQDRTDCSVQRHSWSRTNSSIFQFTLWRWLLTMFVRVFVFLHSVFSFQFECAFEWDCACDFLLTCDLLLVSCVVILNRELLRLLLKSDCCCQASANAWLFWYAMLLVLINCWVRVVSVSSVFSFSTFWQRLQTNNDYNCTFA